MPVYRKEAKAFRVKGFTLLELVIVIIILGIILSLNLPQLKNTIEDLRFREFSQRLYTYMSFLRGRAVLEEKVYVLKIDPQKGISATLKTNKSSEAGPLREPLLQFLKLPRSLNIQPQQEIFFYPDGRIRGEELIILKDRKEARISIEAELGRIKLILNESAS